MSGQDAASLGAQAATAFPPLEDRPIKNTICLFDVDGTLTPARLVRVASRAPAGGASWRLGGCWLCIG